MMEGKHEELEDVESASSDSFIADSDEEASMSAQEDGLHPEEPLTEQEVEELISDFLDAESKAAEAQEALEEESLAKVENDVRDELAQTLHGGDLEKAVADEMTIFREEWEATLDELETESAHLLEQLDGAGIELPSLYKWIEGQAPNGCCTEAWKKRSHWVGCQLSGEIAESIADAEKDLQTQRPVRRKHGRLLEEGASGFLQKKRSEDASKDTVTANSDVDWSCFEKLCSNGASENENSFGSKNWASVYLASTPQQAAIMGLNFPGVNEVEEIEEINDSSMNPLLADAIANEKELVLSEEQKRNFRKVKEEDDEKVDRKFQFRLKHKRYKRRFKQVAAEKEVRFSNGITEGSFIKLQNSDHNPCSLSCEKNAEDVDGCCDKKNEVAGAIGSCEEPVCCFAEPRNDSEEAVDNSKKSKKVIVDSDDESCAGKDSSVSAKSVEKTALHSNMCDLTRVNSVSSRSLTEMFHCTACDRAIIEVQQHPVLKVIICQDCNWLLEEKLRMKNEADCSECYCGWCGGSSDLVNCRSCTTLFCNTCIKRNIGKECLSEAQGSGWLCCCCCPSLVEKLKSELEEAIGLREDVEASTSDTGSDNSDAGIDVAVSSRKRRKKKIRRILDDAELGEETKRKIAIEKERQERLKSMQFPAKYTMLSSSSCNGNLPDEASVEVLGDANTGYIVNVRRENGEEAVRIPPSISAKLKAHQIAGIRFMWENIIQSITNVKSGDKGLGCILAHTMGLGKTFQVIAFLYTAMRSVDLGLKTALIVVPVNVLHNWRQEFGKWRPSEVKPLRVFMLEDVSRDRRADLFAKWRAKGGVFLIGYTAFRNLSLGKYIKDRVTARDFCSALQDGPDILVCDEAHIIKNTRADTTQALKQVKCQRRIALTGSPLQNNLMEYYCMVDFVREGFLGSSLEFRNRFQNPIENGQHTNSTFEDVKIMNQRSHILYEQLKGFVQRMDMSVVKKDLPPKVVFVIAVKLCPLQRTLYKRFLDVYGFTKEKVSNERIRKSFFAGYQALAQIWNHPGILQLTKDRLTKDRGYISREDAAENFIADYSSSDENMDYNMIIGDKARTTNDTLQGKNDYGFFQKDWWSDLLQENSYKELDYSGKLVLLLDILTMCSNVGDKALVFSQSIPTLDLIELYLSKLSRQGKPGKYWKKGKDWYRLDGKTESSERQKLVERFNDPANKRVKCTLISTRAGSLGINLHAANRVIIVDGSWNPTYDLQAIYRAWRYGQKKPVFAYRLMAHGTMEEKIYKRQVTKEGLAARVVDRQQVHRTISKEEMLHLFEFGDDENVENLPEVSQEHKRTNSDMDCNVENSLKQKTGLSHGCCSSDKVMETLLGKHYPRWVANYHEHETLLQENEEEKLSKEEQDMAWEVYRRTLEWEEVQHAPLDETMPDQKPAMSTAAYPVAEPCETQLTQRRGILRDTLLLRKCTKLAHMLTLRSQGTKAGCSTVCGECAQEITWEDLDGNTKICR